MSVNLSLILYCSIILDRHFLKELDFISRDYFKGIQSILSPDKA